MDASIMVTAGDNDIPKNDKSFDDGDFDLSGFADESAAPSGEAKKPAGEKKPAPKAPAKGPKAGYDRPKRDFDRGSRDGDRRSGDFAPPRAGGPRSAGGPRGAGGYGAREGGPRGPGGGSYGSRDAGPRGPGGPRSDGPRTGGFRRDFSGPQDRGDRNDRGESKPWTPRGDRPEGGPRGEGKTWAPRKPGYGGPPAGGDDRPRRVFAPRPGFAIQDATLAKPASVEVKPFLSLKLDKGRWRESRFLLEGSKNIADAFAVSPAMVHTVFVDAETKVKEKELLASIKKARVAIVEVTADDIRALADTETPQGIIAVCNFATIKPDWTTARYVTLLDAVQDPGNVGAIFRTSLALGMDAIVMGKGSCDPYNPKVVRSSVGALLGLPFETGEDLGSKIGFLRQKGFSIVATSSHAKLTLEQAKLRKKVALIVGNEGAGTGASYQDMADSVVRIPLKSKVESLNVAVAHGIVSYQLIHGRTA